MRLELQILETFQDIKGLLSVLMVCISKNRALTILARKFNLPLDNIPVDKLPSLPPKIII